MKDKKKQMQQGKRLTLEEYMQSFEEVKVEELQKENSILKSKLARIEEIIKE